MKHPLAVQFDAKEDAKLLQLMRFHASEKMVDPKIARILRLAANRIDELTQKEKLCYINKT